MYYFQILANIPEELAINKRVSAIKSYTTSSTKSKRKILIARCGFKMDKRMFRANTCTIWGMVRTITNMLVARLMRGIPDTSKTCDILHIITISTQTLCMTRLTHSLSITILLKANFTLMICIRQLLLLYRIIKTWRDRIKATKYLWV